MVRMIDIGDVKRDELNIVKNKIVLCGGNEGEKLTLRGGGGYEKAGGGMVAGDCDRGGIEAIKSTN